MELRRRAPRSRRGCCASDELRGRARAAARRSSARRSRGSTRSTRRGSTGPAGAERRPGARRAASSGRRSSTRSASRCRRSRLGLRWLRLERPGAGRRRALVHGDFRLGNFIVDEHGLAAVIDWELAHARRPGRGHRLALHPLLAVRQRRAARSPGVGELEPFLAAYEAAGGARPSTASGCAGGRRSATSSGR